MYATLEIAKKHLNVESDFTIDDDYITHLIDASERAVSEYLRRPLTELELSEGTIPSDILHAILLMIGNLYANREPIAFATSSKVELSYEYLLGTYRNYRG